MGFSIGSSGANMGPRGAIENLGNDRAGQAFDAQIARRLLGFLRPHWLRMGLAFLLMLGATALTLWTPYLIKVAIDGHIAQGNSAGLNRIALWTAAAFVGIFITTAGQRYLLSWVGQRVLATLRMQLFEHLQRLSLGYHDQHIIGVTVSRVINDVGVINELLSQGLITVIGDLLLLVGIVVVMVSMSAQLAVYTFLILPLMVLLTLFFRAPSAHRLSPDARPHRRRGGRSGREYLRYARDPSLCARRSVAGAL